MKPAALLAELRKRGVELSLSGEDLIYRAPKGSVTPELLSSVKSQKHSIIAELKAEHDSSCEFDNLTRILELESRADTEDHAYAQFVEPVKSKLLSRVGLNVSYVRGDGCYLWDKKGNRYLDCISQYGALPFGYNPEPIWAAIELIRKKQIPNIATQSLLDSAGLLAEHLLDCLPAGFQHVVFTNSGAESIEVAIKLCRAKTSRPGILSTHNGFHGLTTGALAATGSDGFQNGFHVRCQDFQHVPFGDIESLRVLLEKLPTHFAAFIVEPIQGEAGILCATDSYFQQVRELCDRYNILLVFDEVQTGFGRTGDMFAFEHERMVPDVITLAKALGGGLMPCGAVVCQSHAYTTHFGLRHSSTFAANAMASQCGIATIRFLTSNSNQLVENVKTNGEYLSMRLAQLAQKFPDLIASTRGRGYMQAIEFDFCSLQHNGGLLPILADQGILLHLIISHLLHQHNIRLAPTFMGRNVIRIEPPLIFTRANCDELVDALDATIAVVSNANTSALLCHMIDLHPVRKSEIAQANFRKLETTDLSPPNQSVGRQFGFLVHLTDLQDLVEFDPSLSVFDQSELSDIKNELTRSSEPTIIGSTDIESDMGIAVRGHFVLVPHTPQELVDMPAEKAIKQIRSAARVATSKNIDLIGLGGFTSILTLGGVAIDSKDMPALTSGNAYTAATTIEAIHRACEKNAVELSDANVAVVGAAGQIGRVICQLLASETRSLTLVGRDGSKSRTQTTLGQLATELKNTNKIPNDQIIIAQSIEQIRDCEIVVLVSSATKPFILSHYIHENAIVVDSSRPPNVAASVIQSRPDVTWIEGGLIRLPGNSKLDLFAGPSPFAAYACVAETALWALEPQIGLPSAKKILDIETVKLLRDAAKKHGFKVIV